MLTWTSSPDARLSRRAFLRVGSLGGLSLPWLLAQRGTCAAGKDFVKDRSVVLLFLSGGPSQHETFDPKPEAPAEIRTQTGVVQTQLPGVCFGGTFPKLAALADKLAIVRSFVSNIGDHPGAARFLQLANGTDGSLRSVYARLRGAAHPETGLPTYVQMVDPSKDGQISYYRNILSNGGGPGSLGAGYAPFDPSQPGQLQKDMTLHLPIERLQERVGLLESLDKLRRDLDATGVADGMDAFRQQAIDILQRGVKNAFDVSRENPRLLERYDTSRFVVARYKSDKALTHPSPLGHQLLLARRLCEAGVGFVTIGNPSWDMHGGMLEQPVAEGFKDMGPALDHAVSAFIEDVEARGLSDKILLIVTGEMGRTPKLNKDGGRDHWANLTPLLLYGGGLKTGQVIGRSRPSGDVPATEPYGQEHLLATIAHALFDVGQLRVQRDVPAALLRQIEAAQPIAEVMP
ncbi:MAG: DUF1501 domain-containing protein [Planctomycetia bacterium]|nr:DUF1501 domain-containing protein [Planctomycetia bacterium]